MAAERLAAVVSFGPDKVKLLAQAEKLREAARVAEARSFAPKDKAFSPKDKSER
ncbi:MAG: hypothetical protein ACJ798_14985 [Phenylobacterium sp.]